MANEDDDENIPTLHDILRPGDGAPARRSDEPSDVDSETDRERSPSPVTVTETEIEAIAHRVVEKHAENLHKAITEAIRAAIDAKNRERQSGGDDADGDQS